jgi:hypothetical protein
MTVRAVIVVLLATLLCTTADAKLIYESGFENGGELPPDWTIESHGPGPDWGIGGNPSDWHMRVRFGPGGEQDEWLVSPILDLTDEEGINVQFWHWFRTFGEGVAQVRVSINGGGSWENLVEYQTDQFGDPILQVPQADGQAAVRFCWRYLADLDNQWEVDDVRVSAEVPVDMSIVASEGPTAHDYIPLGRDLQVRMVFENLGSQSSPTTPVRFSTSQGSYDASLPSGIAPDESAAVPFMIPGSLVGSSGEEMLTVSVDADGDAVTGNDTLVISPLNVIDQFSDPGLVLLNYDDSADSALFVPLLEASSIAYDSWNRRAGGDDKNLYGLEAWRLIVFTENEIYPSQSEQYSLMRFIDRADANAKRGLVISGDNWLRFYDNGVVSEEFVEEYLRLTYGQEYEESMPSLYPILGNALGVDQILLTDAEDPDVLEPNMDLPGAEICVTYDEEHEFGALAAVQGGTYAALALGFEWKQLIRSDEQIYLAEACLDWLLALKGEGSSGEAMPNPAFRIGPNPAEDRLVLDLFRWGGGQFVTASLLDMAGRCAVQWELLPDQNDELALPGFLRSGAYCLVIDDSHGERWTGRVVVRR